MSIGGQTKLERAVATLPVMLAEAMAAALEQPGVSIGAGAYATELAMCPIAAAVDYAEARDDVPSEWDPAWGTEAEFGRRVTDFVDAFDRCAETAGLKVAVGTLRQALSRRVALSP